MKTLDVNQEQLHKMKSHPGFIAALDQRRKSRIADLYVRFIPFKTEYQTPGQLL